MQASLTFFVLIFVVWQRIRPLDAFLCRTSSFSPTFSETTRVRHLHSNTALYAKKKSSSTSNKTRVKLLVDIKGIGQNNEVVYVSPAQWTNLLAPKKQAIKVSDDEYKKMMEHDKQQSQLLAQMAHELKEKIVKLGSLKIVQKTGPNNKLFGSVSTKTVIEALKKQVLDDGEELPVKISLEGFKEMRVAGIHTFKVKIYNLEAVDFSVEVGQ